jgi:hypothetical protein
VNKSHLTITQAGLVSLLTSVVGQVVAFVPNLRGDAPVIISAGSFVIGVGFLIANAIHHLADSKTPVITQADVTTALRSLIGVAQKEIPSSTTGTSTTTETMG